MSERLCRFPINRPGQMKEQIRMLFRSHTLPGPPWALAHACGTPRSSRCGHPWKRVIARGPLVIEHFVLCRLFYRITESARPNHRISQTYQTISRQFTLRSLASMQAWVARGACKSPATSGLTVLLSRLNAAGIVGAAKGCLAAGAADLSQWNRELFGTSALPSLLRGTASWLCRQADSVPRGTDGCLRHLSPLLLRSWSSAAVVST